MLNLIGNKRDVSQNNNGIRFLNMQIAKNSMKTFNDTKFFLQIADERVECSCVVMKA